MGFADEVWWSRLAQPVLHTWCEAEPLRLHQKEVAFQDPDGKAVACYGLYLPFESEMLLRFVKGRPVSEVTCLFLDWLTQQIAAKGKRSLFLIWDNATWHISGKVKTWVREHNRQVKQKGGCRLIVCQLPSRSPWLNPIEPKWLHGKRAIVEPVRTLSMTELMQRVCSYYGCEQLEPLSQSLC